MDDLDVSDLTFSGFVLSLASTAAVHFGDLPDPATGRKGEIDLAAAARILGVLGMLQLINRSSQPASFLAISNRDAADAGYYSDPDVDMVFSPPHAPGKFTRRDGTPW